MAGPELYTSAWWKQWLSGIDTSGSLALVEGVYLEERDKMTTDEQREVVRMFEEKWRRMGGRPKERAAG